MAKKKTNQKTEKNETRKRRLTSILEEQDLNDILDHQLSIDELERKFLTDSKKGISQREADKRFADDGPNQFTKDSSRSIFAILFESFFTELSTMLWLAVILCFAIYTYEILAREGDMECFWLGITLLVVNIVSGTLSFYQVAKGERIVESFKNLVPKSTTVIREGERCSIPVEQIVLGDLVELKPGDTIPADIRFVHVDDILVDNSAITGESKPQERTTEWTSSNAFESKNIGFFSTNIVEGNGTGIVIARGDDTEVGKIASLAQRVATTTPLNYEIKRASRIICGVAVFLGVLFFVVSYIRGYDWIQCMVYLAGMIVANVPESLVVTIIISLTLAAKRLAKRNCLVKHLEAVETLGCTTVICSDKTGTLTQNKMTVSHLWYDDRIVSMDLPIKSKDLNLQEPTPKSIQKDTSKYEPMILKKDLLSETFDLLIRVVILCNRAVFDKGEMTKKIANRKVIGDASEAALLKFAETVIGSVFWYRAKHPKVCEMPFNSINKIQISIHENVELSSEEDIQTALKNLYPSSVNLIDRMRYLLVVKGAPERVFDISEYLVVKDVLLPITPAVKDVLEDVCLFFGRQGERVLAFADLELPREDYPFDYQFKIDKQNIQESNFPLNGLRLLGMISLVDPPRPSVPQAVKMCRGAGILVIMITGDHPVTAKAIAKRVGIITGEPRTVEAWKILKENSPPAKEEPPEKRLHRTISVCFEEPESYNSIVVTGTEMRDLSQEQLIELLKEHQEVVFARTSPQQKLRVVHALQHLNHVVAMTGDGVNDSPALKKANIGISMGLTGTDISREASDMVLLDDDFASIVIGVEEGRLIFDNLKKSIAFTLTTTTPELLPYMASTLFDIPLPIGIIQILLINVLTCQMPAIALAYEEAERDIMKLVIEITLLLDAPLGLSKFVNNALVTSLNYFVSYLHERPRQRQDRMVNARMIFVSYFQIGLIQAAAGFCSYFIVMADNGFSASRLLGIRPEWDNEYKNAVEDSYGYQWTYHDRKILERTCWTTFFITLVFSQWADAYVCKTRRLSLFQQKNNKWLNYSCCFETAFAVMMVYTPYLNSMLGLEPVKVWYWTLCIPWIIIIIGYDELRKYLIRKYPTGIIYREMRTKEQKREILEKRKRRLTSILEEKNQKDALDHQLSIDELERKFMTDSKKGISQREADKRFADDGPNQFTKDSSRSIFAILFETFFTELSTMLWLAVILCFGVYTYEVLEREGDMECLWLGITLLVVNIVSGTLSFYQVAKGEKIMESFKNLVPKSTTVIREGERCSIPVEKIVLGDLVELKPGDAIPADIRFVHVDDILVDNSAITGESKPQERTTEWTSSIAFESKNIGFFSTNIVEGNGTGIVIARGDDTEVGKIASLAQRITTTTPLNYEIQRASRIICAVAVFLGVLFFVVSYIRGYDWIQCLVYLTGMIVANVPESLVVTIIISLTLAAKRLSTRNCLVKHLEAVETLGSTTVICSDKTGTLTQNKMTVSHLWYDDRIMSLEYPTKNKNPNLQIPKTIQKTTSKNEPLITKANLLSETFDLLLRVVILCNRAVFDQGETFKKIENRKVIGDASEAALLKFAETVIGPVIWYRAKHPKVCEMPFNSLHKLQISIHENVELSSEEDIHTALKNVYPSSVNVTDRMRYLVVVKGAPERVIDICRDLVVKNVLLPITPAIKEVLEDVCLFFGRQGERVLAFADMELSREYYPYEYQFKIDKQNIQESNFPLTGLRLLGMISLVDPPRPSVPKAVKLCRGAGIQVIMITGDHPVTAKAIAKKVGIITGESRTVEEWKVIKENTPPTKEEPNDKKVHRTLSVCFEEPESYNSIIVTGSEMRDLSQEELIDLLENHQEVVFARTSPQQKLRVVHALQHLNHVVAMTGDGVNDSPALKKANIGISMGLTGTDISREAADMILLNDDFASIVIGVEEGRLIFDNLKKSIAFTLTTTTPELLPYMASTLFDIPLPIGIIQILLLNCITCQMPAIALAYEEAERDIMKLRPRSRDDRLVNARMIFVSYFQIGVIESVASFCTYFIVMADNGFSPSRLYGIRPEWENHYKNDVEDSYGYQWTYQDRKVLERTCWTASFITLVFTQWADAFICKTRRISLFQQKNNKWLNISVFVETAFTVILIYTPHLNTLLGLEPVNWWYWTICIPWVIMIIGYDELRKFLIRKYPTGIVYRCTYY